MTRPLTTPLGIRLKNRRIKVCVFSDSSGNHLVGLRFDRLINRKDREIWHTDIDLTLEAAEALTLLLIDSLNEYRSGTFANERRTEP